MHTICVAPHSHKTYYCDTVKIDDEVITSHEQCSGFSALETKGKEVVWSKDNSLPLYSNVEMKIYMQ